MKWVGKILRKTTVVMVVCVALCIGATAAEPAAVAGFHIDNEEVGMFLIGDLSSNLTADISGVACELAREPLSGAEIGTRTLFLIDVSTSMRQGTQEQVKRFLMGMIENKPATAQFAIAAFGGEYRLLSDFTADRYDLAKTLDSLSWNDQASSIYLAVEAGVVTINEKQGEEWTFAQIVVFSDGAENAEDGITKEELYFRLNALRLPVHSIGFKYENNTESLKDLYAISRITNGIAYEQEATGDILAADKLTEYEDGVSYLRITLPDELKDGAVRPLKLSDETGTIALSFDLHMPRTQQATAPESDSREESTPEPAFEPEPETKPEKSKSNPLAVALIVAGVVLAAVAATFAIKGKRGKEIQIQPEPQADATQYLDAGGNATQFLIVDDNKPGGGGIFLILNDIVQPHKRFGTKIGDKAVIGRSPGGTGITIDYDSKISRQHCAVSEKSGSLWIEDMDSANKTYVNDEIVRAPRVLRDSDIITVGKTKLSVRIERR